VTTGAMLYQHLRCTNIPINSSNSEVLQNTLAPEKLKKHW